jgi:hypothetical protein
VKRGIGSVPPKTQEAICWTESESFSARADLPQRPGRRHVESLFDSSVNLPLTGQAFAKGFNL